jgi:hypothetical protein
MGETIKEGVMGLGDGVVQGKNYEGAENYFD